MASEDTQEAEQANHRKMKEVKNEMKKETTTATTIRKLSFFPIPHDHLDDIFLSSGGIE
jgi:hypothetical protein